MTGRVTTKRPDSNPTERETALAPEHPDNPSAAILGMANSPVTSADAHGPLQRKAGTIDYRRMLENSGDGYFEVDLSGNFTLINDAACRFIGRTREESIGLNFRDYMHPDEAQRIFHIYQEVYQTGQPSELMEYNIIRKDGTIATHQTVVTLLRDVSGKSLGFCGIVRDLTRQKAIERALRESEESYQRVLELSPDMIIITRKADGRIVAANDAFCTRAGFTRKELIGHTPIELGLYTDPKNRKRWLEVLRRDGKVQGIELQFINRAGKVHEDLFSAQYIRFKGEACILAVITSITQLKKTQRELERYRRDLEQMVAERTKALEAAQSELIKREKLAILGQLTATVSHELRNPLGVIRSSNFYLQGKNVDKSEKIEKHFRRIDEQVALCDTIVADLLEYTRGSSLFVAKQAMATWMTKVVEQLQETKGVDISLIIPENLPEVHHDKEKMRRVLINVLENAVQAVQEKSKAMRKRRATYRPSISVRAVTVDDAVRICITDNGIGMNEETCRRAFEPLFTTRARGTGIGLANVKKIVEEHGGRVLLNSHAGEGTEMNIVLPRIGVHPETGKWD